MCSPPARPCGGLARPHPAHQDSWNDALAALEGCGIGCACPWPGTGEGAVAFLHTQALLPFARRDAPPPLHPRRASRQRPPSLPTSSQAADAMLRASRARSFAAEYEQSEGAVLGSGAAGAVLRCKHRASGAMVRRRGRRRAPAVAVVEGLEPVVVGAGVRGGRTYGRAPPWRGSDLAKIRALPTPHPGLPLRPRAPEQRTLTRRLSLSLSYFLGRRQDADRPARRQGRPPPGGAGAGVHAADAGTKKGFWCSFFFDSLACARWWATWGRQRPPPAGARHRRPVQQVRAWAAQH